MNTFKNLLLTFGLLISFSVAHADPITMDVVAKDPRLSSIQAKLEKVGNESLSLSDLKIALGGQHSFDFDGNIDPKISYRIMGDVGFIYFRGASGVVCMQGLNNYMFSPGISFENWLGRCRLADGTVVHE